MDFLNSHSRNCEADSVTQRGRPTEQEQMKQITFNSAGTGKCLITLIMRNL